jgi:hypothetical protein
VFTGCLVTASKAVAPSASVIKSLMAGDRFTTNSALLRNSLQQWGLFHLPRLHQGRLSRNSLRLGLVCLLADSLWTEAQTHFSTLTGLCLDPPASARNHREHRFPHFLCCFVHNYRYADMVFRVPLFRYSLLFRNLVTDVSSV